MKDKWEEKGGDGWIMEEMWGDKRGGSKIKRIENESWGGKIFVEGEKKIGWEDIKRKDWEKIEKKRKKCKDEKKGDREEKIKEDKW